MEVLLNRSQSPATAFDDLYHEFDEASLRAAVATCHELQHIGDHCYIDELLARHSHMKQYLPAFTELPFRGELCAALRLRKPTNSSTRV